MAWFKQDGHAHHAHRVSDSHVVNGRMIEDGVARVCQHCGGDRGWRTTGGVVYHVQCAQPQR